MNDGSAIESMPSTSMKRIDRDEKLTPERKKFIVSALIDAGRLRWEPHSQNMSSDDSRLSAEAKRAKEYYLECINVALYLKKIWKL